MHRRLMPCLAALALTACGGGGSGSATTSGSNASATTATTSSTSATGSTSTAPTGAHGLTGDDLRSVLTTTPLAGEHLTVDEAETAAGAEGHTPAVHQGQTYSPASCTRPMRSMLEADAAPRWRATALARPTPAGWLVQLDAYADPAAARAARSSADAKDRVCPRIVMSQGQDHTVVERRLLPTPPGGGTAVRMTVGTPGRPVTRSVIVAVTVGPAQALVSAPAGADPVELRRAIQPFVTALQQRSR